MNGLLSLWTWRVMIFTRLYGLGPCQLICEPFLFAHEFSPQLFLGWQDQLVLAGKELFMVVQDRVADNGFVLVGAENDAHS